MKKSLKNIPVNTVEPSIDDVEFDYNNENNEDADLIRLVEERLVNNNGIRYTWEEFREMHEITDKDLEGWEEVEFE